MPVFFSLNMVTGATLKKKKEDKQEKKKRKHLRLHCMRMTQRYECRVRGTCISSGYSCQTHITHMRVTQDSHCKRSARVTRRLRLLYIHHAHTHTHTHTPTHNSHIYTHTHCVTHTQTHTYTHTHTHTHTQTWSHLETSKSSYPRLV